MKKAIGGYFELELNDEGTIFHDKAIQLNSARNAFEYILRARNAKKVYIPYFICDVILQPINKLGIKYEFYQINKYLEPVELFQLKSNEYLLYVNYFGMKDQFIKKIAKYYKNLIIDNAQAFFALPEKNVDTFYSPRKFFGVPDGGFLYTDIKKSYLTELKEDTSYQRFSHLLKRIDLGAEGGYTDFKNNEGLLNNQPIRKISNLTKKLLKSVNFEKARKRRNQNFLFIHKSLSSSNKLSYLIDDKKINGPMIYPYLTEKKSLRNYLIKNKIYIATYWKNVLNWVKRGLLEYQLTKDLLPLPIDQRYKIEDIKIILELLAKRL